MTGTISSVGDGSSGEEGKGNKADEGNNHHHQQQQKQNFMTMVKKAVSERPAEPPSICEVPKDLIEGNKGAYTPKVVGIGLLLDDSWRTSTSMVRLERYKWCCVRKLVMGRHPDPASWSREVHEPLLGKCFDLMVGLVPQIRASYSSVASDTSSEDVAIKMLLDSCFVLHRLLKHAGKGKGNNDYDDDDWNQQLGRCWVWGTVKRDLLLLSNQVPFFVLQALFKQLGNDRGTGDILVNCGLQLLSSLRPGRLHNAPIICGDVHHLLHLFYLSIDLPPRDWEPSNTKTRGIRSNLSRPPVKRRPPNSKPAHDSISRELLAVPEAELTWWVPCAKELEEAGVRIRARRYGAKSFLDVRFRRRRGILEIPPLELFDYSVPLFRNLIAFEQTYPSTPGRITAYAIFMDCLLKTPQDRGETAMGFFSSLCAEAHTSADRNYLAGVMDQVLKYQKRKWPRWRAALVSGYFTNPWVTTSVVAAVILLTMTVLQSFYAVYGYYKPSK
uniref:Uncharacterized protein n=1 Tax=Aegilops tauschii TaxID=37682 RepID=M8BDY4_AEGTA